MLSSTSSITVTALCVVLWIGCTHIVVSQQTSRPPQSDNQVTDVTIQPSSTAFIQNEATSQNSSFQMTSYIYQSISKTMTVSDILSSATFPKTYASDSLSVAEEPSFSSSQMVSELESLASQNVIAPTASINVMSSSDLLAASISSEIQSSVPSEFSNLAPESTASKSAQLSLQVPSSEISTGVFSTQDVHTAYSPQASVTTPMVEVPFSTSVLPSVSSNIHSVTALPTPTTQGIQVTESAAITQGIQPTESAAIPPSTTLSGPTSSIVPADKGDKEKDKPTKKSTSSGGGGLSSGGKAAVGIVVTLCILGVIIGGIVLYRKYNFTHRSLKSFLTSGVAYKTYNNASYKDDEGMLIMPDRR